MKKHRSKFLLLLAGAALFATGCQSTGSGPAAKATDPAPVAAPAAPPEAPEAPAITRPWSPGDKVVIHYHRFDKNYDQPGLWTWDNTKAKEPASPEVLSSGTSDYGVYFTIDPAQYGTSDDPATESIGFIARMKRDWNFKDGGDRAWTPNMGAEIWLIANDPKIYTVRPDTSPKVAFAFIDGKRELLATLSHPIAAASIPTVKYSVKARSGADVPVVSARPARTNEAETKFVLLTLGADLEPIRERYEVSLEGYRATVAAPRRILDDVRYSTTDPLGAFPGEDTTTFRVFSPTAESIAAVVYDDAAGTQGRRAFPLTLEDTGVWEAVVAEDLEGKFYRLDVTTLKYGRREVIDPYARNTTGEGTAARITDVRAEDPPGFRPLRRPANVTSPTDAIIYQLHVRDFSISPTSGIEEAKKGKFLAFTQQGTRLPSDATVKTGLDHLKELGATHVQLLPIQDFDNHEGSPTNPYSWGYMTAFFESPEGWYATELESAARVREFKQLVAALHEAGIRVIMDVVYNHTGVQNTLEVVAPGYYLRMRDDGSFWDGSGTGNEFRSEWPMGRRLIIDSCRYWVEEYGVDGFRFDLMGLIDLKTMTDLRAELNTIDPTLLLYGEPWAARGPQDVGTAKILYKDVTAGTGIGAFNDHFRDSIKGSPDGDDPGYVVNGGRRDGIVKGLAGSIDDWARNPIDVLNYATVHDNLDLWDKLEKSAQGASDAERRRMAMLAGGILAVSQGSMLLHGGSDFARYKFLDHNSYKSGDKINKIDWERKKIYADVNEFFRGMIALRRAHPVFRLATASEVRARFQVVGAVPAPECIAFTLNGAGVPGETWKDAVIFINPTTQAQTFQIPTDGPLQVFAHDGKASLTPLRSAEGTLEVPPRSMSVLAR